MASFANKISKVFSRVKVYAIRTLLEKRSSNINSCRNVGFFKELALSDQHNEKEYEYEITKDAEEWKFVERLLPLSVVPEPKPKSVYPSGWRPMKEEALKLPYFIQRTKNHMLPVYFKFNKQTSTWVTKVSKIHGDIWDLHESLKAYVEKQCNEKVPSYVNEASTTIYFRGDYVYYIQQWALSKGF